MNGRSILLSRVIKASPEKIWRCWTDPALLPRWFGPEGHSCHTKEIDLRQGGHWLFDMIGPKGEIYPNLHRYHLYDPPRRIEFSMYDPTSDAVHAEVVVILTPTEGGTRITQEMTFPTEAICAEVRAFGAEALGQTTLAKLAAMAESMVWSGS